LQNDLGPENAKDRETPSENRFEKHKRSWITMLLLASVVIPLSGLELGLRLAGAYDPFELSFYTVEAEDVAGEGRVLITPYGEVRINALGYADVAFDLTDPRERVGYIGDSVIYGLGVGHGHRVSDHLRQSLEEYQHFSIGDVGAGVPTPERAARIIGQLGLDKFIFFMNLNDVTPTRVPSEGGAEAQSPSLLSRVKNNPAVTFVDRLRMHSRVYNMVRLSVRNLLLKLGYDAIRGAPAYELHPNAYLDVVEQTASRVNELSQAVAATDAEFCVVLLPYEMQVSAAAERYYVGRGIEWEDGFPERSTQAILMRLLDSEIEVLDAYHAFVGLDQAQPGRDTIDVGEYYLTRAGGALDWNHPNRRGHQRLAEYLLRERPCSF